jgi:beta-xylosidase
MRFTILALTAILLASGAALAQTPQYGDYIDLPGATFPADPTILRVDDTWYLYPTTTSVTIECWSSTDLDFWNYEGVAWGPAPAGNWNDSGVWAPDVFEQDGTYFLYYTADNMIGAAISGSPTGPFVDVYDHPFIGGGWGGVPGNAIDAHMFRDDDGALYLYTTGYAPLTFLRVFPMADPVTFGGDWKLLFLANVLSWERFVVEGPWMTKRNGVYYLQYSGQGANTPWYALGYATSESPMGPFTKYERNPFLRMDWDNGFFGPGHHSLTIGPDGETWIFYHTQLDPEINWERRIRKNKVAFTDDGQLYVDLGIGPPPPLDDDSADDATDDDTSDDADDDSVDDDAAADDSVAVDDDATPAPSGDDDDDDNDGGCCG